MTFIIIVIVNVKYINLRSRMPSTEAENWSSAEIDFWSRYLWLTECKMKQRNNGSERT
jgi:hypothetical protein